MPYILLDRAGKASVTKYHTHSNNNVCKNTQNIPNDRINIPTGHPAGHLC